VLLAVAAAASVSACGKRGKLEAPEGSTYPQSYPAPETMIPPYEDETENVE
jgi:predicted small lipoprotein YifL